MLSQSNLFLVFFSFIQEFDKHTYNLRNKHTYKVDHDRNGDVDDADDDDADDDVDDDSHPDDGVELTHGDLLRPLHRCDHLLLVLEGEGVDCNLYLDLYFKLYFAIRVTFAWILHPVGCESIK